MYKLGTALSVIMNIKERSIDQVTNKARLRIKLQKVFPKTPQNEITISYLISGHYFKHQV